ncbi:MAG: hypothetical protein ACHBN1_36280 [Heteroscytonema crispum UTEX LB 1556]
MLEATKRYVKDTAVNLPIFDGQLALVFDASASTRSYGDREFCCLAQSSVLNITSRLFCLSRLSRSQVPPGNALQEALPLPERKPPKCIQERAWERETRRKKKPDL